MERFFKKIAAVLTVLAITAVQLPLSIMADETTQPPETNPKPAIYIDYLGQGEQPSAPTEPPKFVKQNVEDAAAEGRSIVFWVGLAVDNLSLVEEITSNGMYGIEAAFNYDPGYVKPYTTDPSSDADWLSRLNTANLASDGSAIWDSNTYELTGKMSRSINSDPYSENDFDSGWKMSYVNIEKNAASFADTGSNRFKGISDNDKQYLLKIPFELTDAPEEGATNLPLVFKLSRGPSTLVFLYGDGTTDFAWRSKDKYTENEQTNIKKRFDFKGNLNIFGGKSEEESSMTDLQVVSQKQSETESTEITETVHDLYEDDGFTPPAITYSAQTDKYYTRVAADVTSVKLKLSGSDLSAAEVKYTDSSGQQQTLTPAQDSDGFWYTGDIPLVDTSPANRFNEITVTVGGADYVVYVQKLVQPRIVLNPGNSPYGMIMKEADWSDEQKTEAKAQFVSRNGRFGTTLTPTGGNATRYYRNQAWAGSMDSGTNLDMDDNSIFVYNRTNFRDPGFVAYDSNGTKVDDEKITRSITVSRMNVSGTNGLRDTNQTEDTITVTGEANDYLFTEITSTVNAIRMIRPDVYDMKYSFTDSISGDTVEVIRKVVILGKLGDCDLSNIVNSSDMNAIKGAIGGSELATGTSKESVKNMYIYRIVDTDRSGIINASDMNAIKGAVGGTAIQPIYIALPSN